MMSGQTVNGLLWKLRWIYGVIDGKTKKRIAELLDKSGFSEDAKHLFLNRVFDVIGEKGRTKEQNLMFVNSAVPAILETSKTPSEAYAKVDEARDGDEAPEFSARADGVQQQHQVQGPGHARADRGQRPGCTAHHHAPVR